jgi:hypothetical protein
MQKGDARGLGFRVLEGARLQQGGRGGAQRCLL